MKLILRWIIITLALIVAAWLVPGIRIEDDRAWLVLAITAVIFGLINALIRPVLAKLSTRFDNLFLLGILTLTLNALVFWLTSLVANGLNIGFYVDGFVPALLGSIIVSIVSFALSIFLVDK